MKLETFLKTLTSAQRRSFAEECDSSLIYLYQIAGSSRTNGAAYRRVTGRPYQASPQLALRIEKVSRKYGHIVTRYELRPDLYPLEI